MCPAPHSSIAQKGNYHYAPNTMVTSATFWIINSGASDHTTGCHELSVEYVPHSGNIKIQVADGSLSSVAGKGTITLSNMTLKSVFNFWDTDTFEV